MQLIGSAISNRDFCRDKACTTWRQVSLLGSGREDEEKKRRDWVLVSGQSLSKPVCRRPVRSTLSKSQGKGDHTSDPTAVTLESTPVSCLFCTHTRPTVVVAMNAALLPEGLS